MIGFDDKKKMASLIIKDYLPGKPMSEEGEENDPAMESAAHGFIQAIESKDPKALAEAFCAMFDIYESKEDEEENETEETPAVGEKIEY